jgi:glycosyltransferase involved in cell wall biosynthesis
MPSISYVITAHNEHEELERLLDQLNQYIESEDEILVQLDMKCTPEVKNVAEKYNTGSHYNYHRVHCEFNNDFAAFKNNAKRFCSKDYIFFIDADEYLTENLLINLKIVLEANPAVDVMLVPRINTVEGLTQEHINKWGWRVDDKGYINYPDYQTRICKRDKDILWSGHVHERLIMNRKGIITAFPDGFELIHPKTIERQEKQNNYYNSI